MRTGRALAIAALVVTTATCGTQVKVAPVATPVQPARRVPTFAEVAAAREYGRLTSRYDDSFQKYTKRFFGPAFDWRWFKAQAYAESALNPNSVSWVGARGLMQLMPTTYREIQSEHPEIGPVDQPEWNIAAGIFYNSKLWSWWHFVPDSNRYHFMFGSYNAGAGNIYKAFTAASAKIRRLVMGEHRARGSNHSQLEVHRNAGVRATHRHDVLLADASVLRWFADAAVRDAPIIRPNVVQRFVASRRAVRSTGSAA